MKEDEVLNWLIHQKSSDEIEDVSDVILDQLIQTKKQVAVLFCTVIDIDSIILTINFYFR